MFHSEDPSNLYSRVDYLTSLYPMKKIRAKESYANGKDAQRDRCLSTGNTPLSGHLSHHVGCASQEEVRRVDSPAQLTEKFSRAANDGFQQQGDTRV